MRTSSRTQLLRRFSLWLLGQALPETGALRQPARLAMIGVVVASAAGTLIALSVVAGLVAIYYYLIGEGLSEGASLGVVAGAGLMASAIAFLLARRQVDAIPDRMEELQLFHGRPADIFGELLQMVVGGFMEGVGEKADAAKRTAKTSREQIEEAIESLIDQLDALEDDVAETSEEVVLEIDRATRPRRKS